jgi:hypothetical protein
VTQAVRSDGIGPELIDLSNADRSEGRPVVSEYQVKKAKKPNSGKVWHIVGRPNGKRIRAWFKSKEAAQAEATERNIAMRKLGQNAVA